MDLPTLQAYRAANPSDARTDSQILPGLIVQLQNEGSLHQFPDLLAAQSQLTNTVGRDAGTPLDEMGKAFGAGVSGGEAKLYSTLAQIGGLAQDAGRGNDMTVNAGKALSDYGMQKYHEKLQEAAANAPAISHLSDVHGIGDAAQYAANTLAGAIPQVGGVVASGAVGALAGSVLGPEGTVAGAVGGALGSGAAAYTQSQDYGELKDAGVANPAEVSAGVGALGALIQTYVPAKVFSRAFGNSIGEMASKSVNDVLTKAETALPGVGQFMLQAAGKEGGTAAAAGVAQELMTMAAEDAAKKKADPNYVGLTADEIKNRILESGAAGFLLGAVGGGVEGYKEAGHAQDLLKVQQQGIDNAALYNHLQDQRNELLQNAMDGFQSTMDPNLGAVQGQAGQPDYKSPYDYAPTPPTGSFETGGAASIQPSEVTLNPDVETPPVTATAILPGADENTAEIPHPLDQTVAAQDQIAGVPPVDIPVEQPTTPAPTVADTASVQPTAAPEATQPGDVTGLPPATPPAPVSVPRDADVAPPVETPKPAPVVGAKPIMDELPALRIPPRELPVNPSVDQIVEATKGGINQGELRPSTSRKLLAVYDTKDETIRALPMFMGDKNQWRVGTSEDNARTAKAKVAKTMGMKVAEVDEALKEEGPRGDALRSMYGDPLQKGDMPLADFVGQKHGNEPRFKPLAVLTSDEPVARRVFQFSSLDKFQAHMAGEYSRIEGVPHTREAMVDKVQTRLKTLDPETAKAVKVLSGFIDSAAGNKAVDPIRKLLNIPSLKDTTASAKIGSAADPKELLRPFGPQGKKLWLGLFNAEDLQSGIDFLNDPKPILDQIPGTDDKVKFEKFMDVFARQAGWGPKEDSGGLSPWQDYLRHAHVELGEKQLGSELHAEEGGEVEAPGMDSSTHENVVANELETPQEALAGLSIKELEALQHGLKVGFDGNAKTERFNGQTVLEARADSQISSADEDADFQDAKDLLRPFLDRVLRDSRGTDSSLMDDTQLYKIYSILDRASMDTQPARADYRQASTVISDTYRGVVSNLSGMGVDVNIIESSMDAQSAFLQHEWGQVQLSDARRALIVSVNDMLEPSLENLRVLLHESAHILFAGESPARQALLLDSISRATDLNLDVFSKTRDARISGDTTLTGSALAQEVLAEHMSFMGLNQKTARTFAQKFVAAIKTLFMRGQILWAQMRGTDLDPRVAQAYMEGRMTDFVDRALNSRTDLEALSGEITDKAQHRANMFKSMDSDYHRFDYNPMTGDLTPRDVIPIGDVETLFNLDNKLQFHDVAILDTKPTKSGWDKIGGDQKETVDYFKEHFGLTETPNDVGAVLDKIPDDLADGSGRIVARALKDLSSWTLRDATIRFASTSEDFDRMNYKGSETADYKHTEARAPGVYLADKHEILINPVQSARYSRLGASNLILHEVMHAATVGAAYIHDQYKTLGRDIEALQVMHQDVDPQSLARMVRSMDRVDDIYTHLKGKEFYPGAYGMTNVKEFMSELVSNRAFQIKLSKEMLPEKFKTSGAPSSNAFRALIHWVSRTLGFSDLGSGNGFEESIKAVEKVMMAANASEIARGDGEDMAPPMTEDQSKNLVQRDYEMKYAENNSWMDLMTNTLGPLAQKQGMKLPDYLDQILGIKDPTAIRAALDNSILQRPDADDLQINKDYRLGSDNGEENRLAFKADREQTIRTVIGRAQEAIFRTQEMHDDTQRSLPRLKELLERRQERFSRLDNDMGDWVAARDILVKKLKSQIEATTTGLRDATFWSTEDHGLGGVAANLFGIDRGNALPADLSNLVKASVEESGRNSKLTDLLAAFDKHDVDTMGATPSNLEAIVQQLYKNTGDKRFEYVADGSPKAKADLSLAVYSAKTDPLAPMLLGINGEPKEMRELIIGELKNAVRGASSAVGQLPDLAKYSSRAREKVVALRRQVSLERSRINETDASIKGATKLTAEADGAKAALQKGIDGLFPEIGGRSAPFQPWHGAPLLLTPQAKGGVIDIGTAANGVIRGRLSLDPKDNATLVKNIFDNKAWLDQNQGLNTPEYYNVKSQYEALKGVAGEYTQSGYKKSLYTPIFESVGNRLKAIGQYSTKRMGERIDRMVNTQRTMDKYVFKGLETTEKQKAAIDSWGFQKNYKGFIRTLWNPVNHFLEHISLPNGADFNEYAKTELRKFLAGKPETQAWMRDHPDAFNKLWDFRAANMEGARGAADYAASDTGKQPVLVRDDSIRTQDPFTGKVTPTLRNALDVGLGASQRDVSPTFGIKRMLDGIKGQNGESLWSSLAKEGPITPDVEKALFTPTVIDQFVRPYMDDMASLHIPLPRSPDGQSYGRVDPLMVKAAWGQSKSDLKGFADNLWHKLYGEGPQQHPDLYHQDILDFFRSQYGKIRAMTETQEQFRRMGFDENFLSSDMMDSRKAQDLPPEFVNYRIYDQHTRAQMVENIAAHGTLGRDLGFFDNALGGERNHGIAWEFKQAKNELDSQSETLNTARLQIMQNDPRMASKDVEDQLKQQFGKSEYDRMNNIGAAKGELGRIEGDLYALFNSPNGGSRGYSTGMELLRTTVSFMLNAPRSVLNNLNKLIEPFNKYGSGKLGWSQVGKSVEGFGRSAMGSIVQAFGGQAKMATEYDRLVHDAGFALDRGNFVTPAQIWADSGKNNMYDSNKFLGYLRKGRSVFMDAGFKPMNEEERIAPAFRPQAIYSWATLGMDQGILAGEVQLHDRVFKSALMYLNEHPEAVNNPGFKFSADHLNPNLPVGITDDNLATIKRGLQNMGTTLEIESQNLHDQVAKGLDIGGVVVPKHLVPLICSEAVSDLMLSADINKGPAWMYNSKFGRMAMPLLTWSTLKMNQIVGMARGAPDGNFNWRTGKGLMIAMAAGVLPTSIAISMLLDEYDEQVLGKKSNAIDFNWNDPSQTAAALSERLARIGTFGLAGDVANGIRAYGSDGDTRGISFDQRVVFMNSIMNIMGLMSTAVHQQGNLTYDSFWRPFINTIGGNSFLQYGQIINRASVAMGGNPVLQSEYEVTSKLNATNYLRAAGRATGIEVRVSDGGTPMPNPLHPYISQMVLAAYADNRADFTSAYQKALDEAKSEGIEDPAGQIKRSFAGYQPLRSVFQTPPTQEELPKLLSAMSDKGREDVVNALRSFNEYGALLGLPAYTGKENAGAVAKRSTPTAFTPLF